MNRNRIILALIGLLALGAIAVGTSAALNGAEPGSTPTPIKNEVAASAFTAEITKAFGAATAGAKAELPDDAVNIAARAGGANPAQARFARRSLDENSNIYLVPSNDGFCLTSTSGVEGGCYTGADVSVQSVVCAPSLPSGTVEVYGVAPDGIDAIEIELADKTSIKVPVEGNVFIYRAAVERPRPLTVSWTDANGRDASANAAVPADYRDEKCATPADRDKMELGDPNAPPQRVTTK